RRELDGEDLVVADDSGAIGIGGVMGGGPTELTPASTNVLVEAVCFDPVTVSRSQRRHKLFSEAARRFERGVDPELAPVASARVAELLVRLAGGTLDETLGVAWGSPPEARGIRMRLARPAALVGVAYTATEVLGALEAIGCAVRQEGDVLSVTPPSWRPDLIDDAGLVEEIARITGYDRIPTRLPVAPPGRGLTPEQTARRRISATLAGAGLTEVIGYPFLSAEAVERFTPGGHAFRVDNALDPREPALRLSLLPGLIQIAQRNLSRGLTDVAVFEVGRVFGDGSTDPAVYGTAELPAGGSTLPSAQTGALAASVPPQPWRVGALLLGETVPRGPGQPAVGAGLADALDVVREVALAAGVPLTFRAGSRPGLHPGRTAEVLAGDRVVGVAGELLPAVSAGSDLPRVVAVVELDLDALLARGAGQAPVAPVGTHPAATQDVSLVVPVSVPASEVRAAVVEGAGPLLEEARLVDDYRGSGVPEGMRSLTFALRFRAPDRTLTAADATAAKLNGVALAAERTGAALRE
ncbi:MAG: phenylalanine--tRNA ligase subunit beta, partial [Micrococcales bacterium]|nr:phenylalanine--tRNA ligase subunit beta [Micrococcales bacterium]